MLTTWKYRASLWARHLVRCCVFGVTGGTVVLGLLVLINGLLLCADPGLCSAASQQAVEQQTAQQEQETPKAKAAKAAKPARLPAAARLILARAGKLIETKEYSRAVTLITGFQAEGDPGEKDFRGRFHPEVFHVLGVCLLQNGQMKEAAIALDQALKRDPGHLSALLNRAKVAYELEDYPKAAECFTRAYENDPQKKPEHLYYAAVARLLAKDVQASLALFERLLKLCPDDFQPQWRENLVHVLLEAEQGKKAIPHIVLLTELYRGEKRVRWQEILLNVYLQQDMHAKALKLATSLTQENPTEAKWWRALVHIHLSRNRYQPALIALVLLGYIEPLNEQEKRLQADLYLQLGVPGKAAPLYSEILADLAKGGGKASAGKMRDKQSRQSLPLLLNTVAALQQLGRETEAIKVIDQYVEGIAGGKVPLDLLSRKADLLYSVGAYSEAAGLYTTIAGKGEGKEKDRARRMADYARLQADRS